VRTGRHVNEQTIDRIKAKIICGAANNQLATDAIGDELFRRGVLYAPDYAVNAGGVMNVSLEIDGYNRERAMRMMRTIYYNLGSHLRDQPRQIAPHGQNVPTYLAGGPRLAEERINAIGKIKLPHMGNGSTQGTLPGRMRGQ
jgi:leucine dehydrogenase